MKNSDESTTGRADNSCYVGREEWKRRKHGCKEDVNTTAQTPTAFHYGDHEDKIAPYSLYEDSRFWFLLWLPLVSSLFEASEHLSDEQRLNMVTFSSSPPLPLSACKS